MVTHIPTSPTHTHSSTMSESDSFVHSLDNLSLSTGSFDLVLHPASASAAQPDSPEQEHHSPSQSGSTHSAHSRQTSFSGSLISAPGSYGGPGGDEQVGRRSSASEEDEVILLPRSLASSVTGASLERVSREGTPVSHPPRHPQAGDIAQGLSALDQLLAKTERIDYQSFDSESAAPSDSPSASRPRSKKAEAQARRRKIAKQKAAADRMERLSSIASSETGESVSSSEHGAGSYSGVSSEDVVKVEKGKLKPTRRSGLEARKRAAKGDSLAPGTPSTPKKGPQTTTYNISGTPRVIDKSALDLLTGRRAPATPPAPLQPPTPKLQQASLQKLHLLDLLNNGSTSGSSAGGSRNEDDDSDSDEEEAGGEEADDTLTDLGTPEVYRDVRGETPVSGRSSGSSALRRRRAEGSITSADDARSSIDDFMVNPGHRMSREETLRFWQSLCFELGLAGLDEDEPYLPDLPTSAPSTTTSAASSATSDTTTTSPSSSRSTTPTQISRPMPQTLWHARTLLKSEGHINIADYFDARKADQEAAAAAAAGAERRKEEDDKAGRYAHLVQPSAGSMRKYTRSSGRFVQLEWVKAEAMQPLLRDFGFKRGRERREGGERE